MIDLLLLLGTPFVLVALVIIAIARPKLTRAEPDQSRTRAGLNPDQDRHDEGSPKPQEPPNR